MTETVETSETPGTSETPETPETSEIAETSATAKLLENKLGLSYIDARHTDDLTKLIDRQIIRALVVPSRTDFILNKAKSKVLLFNC